MNIYSDTIREQVGEYAQDFVRKHPNAKWYMRLPFVYTHGPCVGVTLFKWGQRKWELWYVPANYVIEPHSHPSEDIDLMVLRGADTYLYRMNPETGVTDAVTCKFPDHFGKRFTIPAGYTHGFSVSTRPLVFINFAKWKPGVKVTSAAVDFQLS